MKISPMIALMAATALLFVSGCGDHHDFCCGGGGSGFNGANVSGIWTGTSVSPSGTSTLNVQFYQQGGNLSGGTQLIVGGVVYIGALNGNVNGNSISITVDYGTYGTANGSLMLTGNAVSGNMITGTSVRTLNGKVVETDTINLAKSAINSTASVSSNPFRGTYTYSTSGSQPLPLLLTITQSQNGLEFMGTMNSTISVMGTGAIIGNTIAGRLNHTGSSDYTDIVGTVNTGSITGTFYEPGTNSGNNGAAKSGTFNLVVTLAQ